MGKTKFDQLPFYEIPEYEGRVYHKFCSGEITFGAYNKHRPYSLLGCCDRCSEILKCDVRTLRKTLKTFKGEVGNVTRKRLIEELQTRPLYPVSKIEEFDASDNPVMVRFDNGAALVRDPQQPYLPIVGIRVTGGWKHVKKNRPKQLLVTRAGAIRGNRRVGASVNDTEKS